MVHLSNHLKQCSSCIEELTQIRKVAVARSFLDALTRGGPGGMPRPIELHAHDPLRYIGDMLAWIHQSSAGEKEIMEGLLLVSTDEGILHDVIFIYKLPSFEQNKYEGFNIFSEEIASINIRIR